MKQFAGVLTIILLSNAADANAGDQLGTNGVQNSQGRVPFFSGYRLSFTKYNGGRLNAVLVRPLVPLPVIDSDSAFFQRTGDGSAGDWTRP
jgi:hypothetical protein